MSELTRRGAVAATVAAGVALLGTAAVVAADPPKSEEEKLKLRAAVKKWYHFGPYSNMEDAVKTANLNPPQGAGEFVASARPDGKFEVALYF